MSAMSIVSTEIAEYGKKLKTVDYKFVCPFFFWWKSFFVTFDCTFALQWDDLLSNHEKQTETVSFMPLVLSDQPMRNAVEKLRYVHR